MLEENGLAVKVVDVVEDKKRGLVARFEKSGDVDEDALSHLMGQFVRPWEWYEEPVAAE